MTTRFLPTLNAFLNGTCALLLVAGYLCIRRKKVQAHRIAMTLAFAVSVLFLISYLTYHFFHGSTRFTGAGWIRPAYFAILISHTLLAVVIVPLVIRTLYLARRSRFEEHRRIARRTLPLWLYVSVTGVIVYWMLYHVNWASACPSCSEAIASQSNPALAQKLTQGYSRSIALLMGAPYLVFAGVALLIVRSSHRRRTLKPEKPPEGSGG